MPGGRPRAPPGASRAWPRLSRTSTTGSRSSTTGTRSCVGAWVDVWITLISFVLACVLGIAIALLRISGLRVLSLARVRLRPARPRRAAARLPVLGLLRRRDPARRRLHARAGGDHRADRDGVGLHGRDLPRRRSASVDAGHVEAATALGFTRRATFRHVVFPQALRIALPPLGNTLIGLLKGATLISVIGVADMVFVAQQINLDYFTPFEPFTAVAVILVVLVAASPPLITCVERAPPPAVIAASRLHLPAGT